MSNDPKRWALCHEWITVYGGSEIVASRLARALGIQDVFTFALNDDLASSMFSDSVVRSVSRGWMSRLAGRHWQWLLPLMPSAWRHLDLATYDVVITSAHSCVNAIRVRPGALHITYCHTPMRYAWNWRTEIRRVPWLLRPLLPLAAAAFRRADRRWAQSVSEFIANSRHVAGRISSYYGRDATVIYPPVDTAYWTPSGSQRREDFWLVAGRLVPYKRTEMAVLAANRSGDRLVVAGGGPQLGYLKHLAGSSIEFVEEPSRDNLRDLYRRAKALLIPGVEDFGMTMVESQACGTPVIAIAQGGALEAVAQGQTGLLYQEATVEALAHAMRKFDPSVFSVADMRGHVKQFDSERFDSAIRDFVSRLSSSAPTG